MYNPFAEKIRELIDSIFAWLRGAMPKNIDPAYVILILSTIFIVVISALLIALFVYLSGRRRREIYKRVDSLVNNSAEIPIAEFLALRNMTAYNGTKPALARNFAGIYILCNLTKNMYYVGQGREVLNRVNHHFTGSGNGDVYADYKYGDQFTVRFVPLENSGYPSLNALERDAIMRYDAFHNGYNKTRGNRD